MFFSEIIPRPQQYQKVLGVPKFILAKTTQRITPAIL